MGVSRHGRELLWVGALFAPVAVWALVLVPDEYGPRLWVLAGAWWCYWMGKE